MPAKEYASTRADGIHIGKTIKQIVELMLEGETWQRAADSVGLNRQRAYRALHKPHVIAYRREKKKELVELLSARVPLKLSDLMDSENHAAAVRAALALTDMNAEAQAEPVRRIHTGGIVIVIGQTAQRAVPQAAPALELQRFEEEVGDG